MTGKFIGAALILSAGGAAYLQKSRQFREEIKQIAEMAAALEEMESAIRFRGTPMTELLRQQTKRTQCGEMFSDVLRGMKREIPLQKSWTEAVEAIRRPELRQVLQMLELGGDRQRITENLRLCARELRRLLRKKQDEQKKARKTTLAWTVSASGLLVILLL